MRRVQRRDRRKRGRGLRKNNWAKRARVAKSFLREPNVRKIAFASAKDEKMR